MSKPKCECGWDLRLLGCPVHGAMPASAEAAPLPALVEQLTEAGKALHRRGLKLLDGDAEWVGCSHFIETGDLLLAAAAALRVAASAGRGEQECAE